MKFQNLWVFLTAIFLANVSSQQIPNEPESKTIAEVDHLNVNQEVFVLINGKKERLNMTSP